MTQPFTLKADDVSAPPPPAADDARIDPPGRIDDADPDRARSDGLLTTLAALVLGLVALAIVVDLSLVVAAAASAPSVLGILTAAVYLAVVCLLGVVTVRQIAGLMRLEALGSLRGRVDGVRAGLPGDGVYAALARLYARRSDTAWSYAQFAAARADAVDDTDRLGLFEDTVLAPLDARATQAITQSARRTALFTAISPFVALDMLITLWRSLVMLRAVAAIYGARASGIAALRLLRRVIGQVALAAGLEATNDVTAELLGGGVTARISARIGEGMVNGLFMIRLGVAAMEACRPVGFDRQPRPTILALGRCALSSLKPGD